MTTHTNDMQLNQAAAIWVARLDQLRLHRSSLLPLLSAAEHVRHQRYLQQDDRDRYLGGRALVKLAVAKMCGVSPGKISISTTATGKPFVLIPGKNIPVPAISISHAGDLVVVALQYTAVLGVDVELFNHDVNLDDLMSVVCSEEEIAEINLSPHKDRAKKFYEIWVLKEAYLKATGEGLSADARRLVFSVDAASRVSLLRRPDNDNGGEWDFALRQHDGQHLIALASRKARSGEWLEHACKTEKNIPAFIDAGDLLGEYCSLE